VAEGLHAAGPEVGGAARFHDDGGLRELGEELGELGAGEAPVLRDLARVMRDRDLEDGLCEIDRDESIVLHGMDSFCLPDSSDFGTRCRLSRRRGPSHQMQLTKLRAAPVLQADVPPCAPAGKTDGAPLRS
jgi:hypothetical protein